MTDGKDHGRSAAWPSELSLLAWKDILLRVWSEVNSYYNSFLPNPELPFMLQSGSFYSFGRDFR